MLVTIDKRGSINLPANLRKELGIKSGSHLDVEVMEGGAIVLRPVIIYPTTKLNDMGLAKLQEARKNGTGKLPNWLVKEMKNAHIDTNSFSL
ncbi:MAG: AbrB/MazE/SpoVT family DNA-binding domain-containing protein [Deltaproteobacteria bacterium]|nr:AbrB/MazE/SpoVT family DNA-binding domain-containing protein [Deltaproteobacteria bacterium]